jgi:phage-related minor tail protein
MSMKLGELVTYLRADDGPLRRGLKSAEAAAQSFGGSMKKGLKVAGGVAGAAAGGALAMGVKNNLDISESRAKLAAQLGLSAADSAKYGAMAGKVYAGNYGSSLEDVNGALMVVKQNLGGIDKVGAGAFQTMTQSALTLSSTFGVDVAESTNAVSKLIKNGLAKNATEAFDIIAKGMQSGANRSGDFIDTLNEYSPQFAKLGMSGSQVLTLLSAGLKAGARDTDTIADAFKEFSLRAIDGSKTTVTAYQAIGLNARTTAADIAKGGSSAGAATQRVLVALSRIKDPIAQNAAGVALFGTQWEDTLRKIIPAMAAAGDKSITTAGAMQKMTDTAGSGPKAKMESMKRSMEAWINSLTASSGPMGTFSSGLLAFGGPALATAASVAQVASAIGALDIKATLSAVKTKALAAAQWLLKASMGAGAILTTVAAYSAHAVAAGASAAATGVWTAAQWLWQASISAAGLAQFLVVSAAHKVATLGSAVVTGAWTAAQWLLNAALTANPIGVVIMVIAALVVAIIIAYKKSTTFRAIVQAAMRGIVIAFHWLWDAAKAVFSWIGSHWRQIYNLMTMPVRMAVSIITSNFSRIISAVRRIPGRIRGAFSGAGRWLVSAGRAIVQGLWSGIVGLAGWLASKVSSFISATVPGPIRKVLGIASPSRVARYLGRMVPTGLALGIGDATTLVVKAASKMAGKAIFDAPLGKIGSIPTQRSHGRVGGRGGGFVSASSAGGASGVYDLGGDSALVALIKKLVREKGGGSVQVAFGTGR